MPGIGKEGEARLWQSGYNRWEDLMREKTGITSCLRRKARAGSAESISRLKIMDHAYFQRLLPNGMQWRAYNEFRDYTAYLDIETTGLSPRYDDITTVCLHSEDSTRAYVNGQNLQRLKEDLGKFKYLVTFNGSRFDLPFLKRRLGIRFDQIHLDLLYPLRCLGYHGGLKRVESMLGITRESEGLDGRDAVRLWKCYLRGTGMRVGKESFKGVRALEKLIEYNMDDTVNLRALADMTVEMLAKVEGLPEKD